MGGWVSCYERPADRKGSIRAPTRLACRVLQQAEYRLAVVGGEVARRHQRATTTTSAGGVQEGRENVSELGHDRRRDDGAARDGWLRDRRERVFGPAQQQRHVSAELVRVALAPVVVVALLPARVLYVLRARCKGRMSERVLSE